MTDRNVPVTGGMVAPAASGGSGAGRVLVALVLAGIVAATVVFALRLLTDLAIPGWASVVVGMASIISFQCILISSIFAFIVLGNRHHHGFQPQRDHATWLLPVRRLRGPAPGPEDGLAAAYSATTAGTALPGVHPER
jgi:hypothetical protein